jgi:cellulose biosynthesis protein BcsQ
MFLFELSSSASTTENYISRTMTEQAPDDIFALYSQFDLDESTYRVFPQPKPTVAKPRAATLVMAEHPVEQAAAEGPCLKSSALLPAIPSNAPPFISVSRTERIPPKALETDGSRAALHNLWLHVKPKHEDDRNATASSLATASISVYGAAGGVGTTTVAAVLTRLLAKSGRRCAIFDQTGDSTLPIFFGAQKIAEDHRRFSGLHALFEPRIRILSRDMFEPIKAAQADGMSFIERNFSDVAGEIDHLIFDHPARCADNVGAGLKLCVAIPDLSSLAGTRKLVQRLESANSPVRSVCILNRFESKSALHQEVLGWYHESFHDVVTIRDSHLLPEALAEGTTVMDWSPDAPISTDFFNLFAVINGLLASASEGSLYGSERPQ